MSLSNKSIDRIRLMMNENACDIAAVEKDAAEKKEDEKVVEAADDEKLKKDLEANLKEADESDEDKEEEKKDKEELPVEEEEAVDAADARLPLEKEAKEEAKEEDEGPAEDETDLDTEIDKVVEADDSDELDKADDEVTPDVADAIVTDTDAPVVDPDVDLADADSEESLDDAEKEFDVNDDSDIFLNDEEENEAKTEFDSHEASETPEEEKAEEEEKVEDEVKEEGKSEDSEEAKEEEDKEKETDEACDVDLKKEEKSEEEKKKDKEAEEEEENVDMEEHMKALFNGEELSEEFQKKAQLIFEAAVKDQVVAYARRLKVRYNKKLAAAKETVYNSMANQVDGYLNDVVQEWVTQNKVAVTHGLRQEITESFITDLRTLFETHNIMVPEGKENLVESFAGQVEKLKSQLEESNKKNEVLKKKNVELKKVQTFSELCEGLADTEIERLKSLTSNLQYDETYKSKVVTIRENYFSKKKVANVSVMVEELAEPIKESEKKEVITSTNDSFMKAAVKAAKAIRN